MQEMLAYIDAGTGSVVVQALIGALLGGMFFFRGLLAKIARKISPKKPSHVSTDDDETAEDADELCLVTVRLFATRGGMLSTRLAGKYSVLSQRAVQSHIANLCRVASTIL